MTSHAPDGRVHRRGHAQQVAEEGRRRGEARRAAVRDLDRQGRRRDSRAGGRHAGRDQGAGRPDGAGADAGGGDRDREAAAAAPAPAPAAAAARAGAAPRRRRSPRRRRTRARAAAAAPAPAAVRAARAVRPTGDGAETAEERLRRRVHAAGPQDRRRASASTSRAIPGTGLAGRVTKQDILGFIERGAPRRSGAPTRSGARPPGAAPVAIEHPGRRAVARRPGRAVVQDPQDHRRSHDHVAPGLGARRRASSRSTTRGSRSCARSTRPRTPSAA